MSLVMISSASSHIPADLSVAVMLPMPESTTVSTESGYSCYTYHDDCNGCFGPGNPENLKIGDFFEN